MFFHMPLMFRGNHVKPEHRIPINHFHTAGKFMKGFPKCLEIVRLLQKIPDVA